MSESKRQPNGGLTRFGEWEVIESLCTSADLIASAWRKAKVFQLSESNNEQGRRYSSLE
jgi:hypothetical protein